MKVFTAVRARMAGALFALSIGAVCSPAYAQSGWPNRPIQFVIPFAVGGGSDVMARIIAEPLSRRLGQPVVVVNKPGGNATIGADSVAKSAPDGNTWLYTTPGPQITNPSLMKQLPYDPARDLLPVARLGVFVNVLAINPKLPVGNVAELVAYAKAHPGKLSFASPGTGSGAHLAGEYLKRTAGVEMVHVPYKGTGAAIQDLVAGSVDLTLDSMAALLPMVRSGQLRAIAVGYTERAPSLPDTPTLAESFPGFDASPMNYLSVRGGTPDEIVDRLNREINAVLESAEVRDRLLTMGVLVSLSSPAAIASQVQDERQKWQRIIKASGVEPQ